MTDAKPLDFIPYREAEERLCLHGADHCNAHVSNSTAQAGGGGGGGGGGPRKPYGLHVDECGSRLLTLST